MDNPLVILNCQPFFKIYVGHAQTYREIQPNHEPRKIVWTGESVKRTFIIPHPDGYKQWPSWGKDTPKDELRHRQEQARAFGVPEPTIEDVLDYPDTIEYWRAPFKVVTNDSTTEQHILVEKDAIDSGDVENRMAEYLYNTYRYDKC